ncbi:LOW QUALITY PROTEIN: hypothetical protein MAR_014117 [Mya arenaria]|uniref:DUF659 domain-containing protein n=1 Tax=Mya arenaria TaxID=6604 RepID=A0ABY7G1S2_MYAAR|nr:LOW QUALITY PROTEIN: hypothetical protein MAR_014117 [Mya arenaria]
MSGYVSGVQARITNLFPRAKYFTHCASHCINLVFHRTPKYPKQTRNLMNTIKEQTFFLGYSAKRKDILKTFLTKDRFKTIVVAVLTQYALGFVRPLSVSLQGKSCNL